MIFGGLISILIAIWIYRTAIEAKIGNAVLWVAGSVVVFLAMQMMMMIYFNAQDNSDTAGLQSGSGGTFIGIIFELIPLVVPFFVVALIRQLLMLKQGFSFSGLFSGIKEMFIGIKDSFKTGASGGGGGV